jgi:hypothetical protein
MNTRRDFLICCSLLTAGASLDPLDCIAAPFLQRARCRDAFGLSSFAQCVHTPFRIVEDGRFTVSLDLIEARANCPQEVSGEHQFSLLFRASDDAALRQDTYAFEHATLGRFSMFIVPVALRDGKARYYEAVFNRTPGLIA